MQFLAQVHETSGLVAVALGTILAIILWNLRSIRSDAGFLGLVLAASFLVRFGWLLIVAWPGSGIGVETTWEAAASSGGMPGAVAGVSEVDLFFLLTESAYSFGENGRFATGLLNLTAFLLFLVHGFRTLQLYLDPLTTRIGVLLLAVYPSGVFLAAHVVPDMLSAMAVSGALWAIILFVRQGGIAYFAVFCAWLLFLALLRPHFAAITALVLMGITLVHLSQRRFPVAVVALAAGFASLALLYLSDSFGLRSEGVAGVVQRTLVADLLSQARSSQSSEIGLASIFLGAPAPARFVLGFVPFTIHPFPIWQGVGSGSLEGVFYGLDVILVFPLMGLAAFGTFHLGRFFTPDRFLLPGYLFLVAGTSHILYGGLQGRYRLQFIIPMVVLGLIGSRYIAGNVWLRALYFSTYPLLILLYFGLVS